MKKKIVSIILVIVLCFSTVCTSLAAEPHSNFTAATTYTDQFTDVKSSDWFFPFVKQSYEYGLLVGRSETAFAPNENFSIAETIALAARIHSIYTTGSDIKASSTGSWYDAYVEYALANDIISSAYDNYTATAARSEVAVIFANALPDEVFAPIRTVADNAIPDVTIAAPYAAAVYKLYRAGILSGSDALGTFRPNSGITRSEIATICVMIADPSKRSTAQIGITESNKPLTPVEISEKCSPAIFYIETYALNGSLNGSGSGFFISPDGLAITNHHVAANTSYLTITLPDGTTYSDVEIVDIDSANDLALLKVNGSGFSYLEMGDSSTLKQGQQIYAIGSPYGLENTMSQGIISNPKRLLDGCTYIQISVPITYGSSGGALLDKYGKVVGVTSAGFNEADLNLAIPINQVKNLDLTSTEPWFTWASTYYPTFVYALDFGAFSGVELINAAANPLGYVLEYNAFDFYEIFDTPLDYMYEHTLGLYSRALVFEGMNHITVANNYEGVYESANERLEITSDLDSGIISIIAERIPQYYEEFSVLPDAGWYTYLNLESDPGWNDIYFTYTYNYSEYYYDTEIEAAVYDYVALLISQGYTYLGRFDTAASYALFLEGNGLTVACVVGNDGRLYIELSEL